MIRNRSIAHPATRRRLPFSAAGACAIAVVALGAANPTATAQQAAASEPASAIAGHAALAELAEGAERHAPEHSAGEINAAIDRGIEFFLESQNTNGSWGSPTRTKGLNIYAPVPGAHHAFRCAVTSLAVSAIIESGRANTSEDVAAALARGEEFLLAELAEVRRAAADAIYNVWAHAYGIKALVRMRQRALEHNDTERVAECLAQIETQIELATRYESVNGGWGYYDFDVGSKRPASSPTSFTTATMLLAFLEAEQVGIDIDDAQIERAIDSIERQRNADNTYAYGEYLKMRPLYPINRAGGSLGRSQACNIALRLWGDESIDDRVLVEWLNRLRDRNGWLDIGRKRPVPHESWFQVAGYFFYYGHYYGALCVDDLPEPLAAPLRNDLAHIILALQEKDGSWWDFPFYDYHQPYGTAYAVMTLLRCLPERGARHTLRDSPDAETGAGADASEGEGAVSSGG